MTRSLLALSIAVAVAGCQSEQTWSFTNGVGLPVGPPPRIVAEVFDAEECGFSCRPEGARTYCHELIGGAAGPAPEDLEEGRRYCFLGTAINELGEAFALGCAVVEAGGDDVDITLSALEEARVIARQCDAPRPIVRIDASVRDAGPRDSGLLADSGTMDAGVFDAGAFDAGTFDGGTRPPSGLANGTAIVVRVSNAGLGSVFVTTSSGTPLGPQPVRDFVLEIETVVGLQIVLRAQPDSGRTFVRWDGSDCGSIDPCTFEMDRTETVRAVFE